MNESPKRQPDGQMKKWRIKKAEEEHSGSELNSDEEFLAELVAHMRTSSPKGNDRSPESHQVKSLKYFE